MATGFLRAEIIFREDFNGSSDDLDGSAPDIRPGTEAWVASPVFNQDGSVDPSAGSATLEFTPVDGNVYQLDISLREVSGDQNWFALGFGAGQSNVISAGNRFINNLLIGKAWMLFRGNTDGNQTFLGTATSGTQNVAPWTEFTAETGDVDMRIELDTRGGSGSWTATWFAKKPADPDYTEVREQQVLADETIDSVGIALANTGVDGRIESFSLSDTSVSSSPLTITGVSYSPGDKMATLTWTSSPGEIFTIKYSNDMTNWDNELEDSINADPGAKTTGTFDVTGLEAEGNLFFRVEKQ
jgi:hypothetical protein